MSSYSVKRGWRKHCSYTLAELQRGLADGTLLFTDLARKSGTEDWIPLPQLLASSSVATPAGRLASNQMYDVPGSQPAAYAQAPHYSSLPMFRTAQNYASATTPVPPALHWSIVMLLGMATFSIFTAVWAIFQTAWVKTIEPSSKALNYLLLALAAVIVNQALHRSGQDIGILSALLGLSAFVLICLAEGAMCKDLEDYYNSTENIHLHLSRPMIFFFNVLYFQYHLSRIAKWKKTGVLT